MQQFRRAYGGNPTGLDQTIDVLNEVIRARFPEEIKKNKTKATDERRTAGKGSPSRAHEVTQAFIRKVEEGWHDVDVPKGLARLVSMEDDKSRFRGTRVPQWLVEGYDDAFAADGFLIDMYHWMVSMQQEQESEEFRNRGPLPAEAGGQEHAMLSAGFEGASSEVADLLRQQAAVVGLRLADLGTQSWAPSDLDVSLTRGEGEDDLPDGTLVGSGETVIYRWVLYNAGKVPWRHRYLLRVGDPSGRDPEALQQGKDHRKAGIRTPPFVPVPDTDPGGRVEIRCPMRAPRRSGTYRVCMKMGWPDGTYCFPKVTLGAMAIMIVPPADLTGWREQWRHEDA